MRIEKGRTAIVVGAGAPRGIGAACARRFAREGLTVLVAGRTPEKVAAVADEIAAAGGQAHPVAMDATRPEDVARLFDEAEKLGGPPDLVVYNAGNNRFAPLTEMSEEMFEELWRLCTYGGFLVGRETARRVLPPGEGVRETQATLVFTGATASLRARPPFTAFASAKAGERALAHGMAREFGPRGLHVAHAVIDGVVNGEQVNSRFPQIRDQLGAQGMLEPDAVADAYWTLHMQHPTTWTLELDLRPYKEKF